MTSRTSPPRMTRTKDNASDATEIEPDANKGEKPNEAQKPAEPTKSDSKKDETPASKPSRTC